MTGRLAEQIVVLDGHALNPGDLDWGPLRALGREFRLYERSTPAEALARAASAPVVVMNKIALGEAEFAQLPRLRYVGVLATGYNVVDTEAAARHGIAVTNIPAYSTESVAQHTMALLLEHANRVGEHAASVLRGDWCRCPDFCYWTGPLMELHGLRFGIIGYGKIGQAVARIARAFGMEVVAAQSPRHRGAAAEDGTALLPLDEVLATSDVVSLHCPLTKENRHLLDAPRIARMKRGAILLNTARGPLVDSAAVAAALAEGRLGGFGADVLDDEPPPETQPLLHAPNSIVTPHVAWASRSARQRLLDIAVGNLKAWLDGRPRNVVN